MNEITTPDPRRLRRRLGINVALAVVAVVAVGLVAVLPGERSNAAPRPHKVPHSAVMEKATGVRFTRVAVVGDKGLVTLFYVVIDPEKATLFQSDRDHPPRLTSDDRDGGTQRASIMRAGHQMRAGQTYYLVYENTLGAIRSGERATIRYGGHALRGMPVL
jgi:hypothetical protein